MVAVSTGQARLEELDKAGFCRATRARVGSDEIERCVYAEHPEGQPEHRYAALSSFATPGLNSPKERAADDSTFIFSFKTVVDEAVSIVEQRDAEGRNRQVKVKDQFESTEFVIDIIRMKCQRAKSYLAAGNFAKFKEEMQDVINYGAFTIVFEDLL